MVEQAVRLSTKSQVVIPKIFREHLDIPARGIIVFQDIDQGVLIKKQTKDPIEILRETAREATKRRGGKKAAKIDPHAIYEQFEKREKRAGL